MGMRQWWRRWRTAGAVCMVCNRGVAAGEFTCGDEACEMIALGGQAMLAGDTGERTQAARRVRFRRTTVMQGGAKMA